MFNLGSVRGSKEKYMIYSSICGLIFSFFWLFLAFFGFFWLFLAFFSFF
jgi:hypothetical protein